MPELLQGLFSAPVSSQGKRIIVPQIHSLSLSHLVNAIPGCGMHFVLLNIVSQFTCSKITYSDCKSCISIHSKRYRYTSTKKHFQEGIFDLQDDYFCLQMLFIGRMAFRTRSLSSREWQSVAVFKFQHLLRVRNRFLCRFTQIESFCLSAFLVGFCRLITVVLL